MSNLMHKVKDALTGHNEHKGSSHDSSDQNIEQNRGQYNSSAMGSEARDAYGTNPQDNSIHNPRMSTDNNKNAGRSATKNTDDYGSGGYSAGGFPDSKKSDLKDPLGSNTMGTTENQGSDTANTYGSSTTGTTGAMGSHDAGGGPNTGAYHDYTRDSSGFSSSDRPSRGYDSGMGTGNSKPDASTYNSSYAGGYGSSELNTGQMPVGASTSEYGASGMGDRTNDTNLGGSHGYNTRSNAGSNMANQMESRGESELNNRTDQQGFGGTAAAGGSSSNTQRRSSGPHSSNLLNKLDPRVRSSDYENQTAGGQQRGW
ncbi:hypothetical protein N7481_004536 [Penicillium waksmanii]|uniref:uncharacterized protein n=1 Tax=Penicillium waksmanii TaxID=69791 RepID=UPI002546B28E|nr:uncharacterized protein N7481_004536 [Penicillium waksmanii]KAJ5989326.1 hypothetical protein N7481_004536 [Penicillium waksmanii]